MIELSLEEKLKFAAWLQQRAMDDKEVLLQVEKINSEMMVKVLKKKIAAYLLVAEELCLSHEFYVD